MKGNGKGVWRGEEETRLRLHRRGGISNGGEERREGERGGSAQGRGGEAMFSPPPPRQGMEQALYGHAKRVWHMVVVRTDCPLGTYRYQRFET